MRRGGDPGRRPWERTALRSSGSVWTKGITFTVTTEKVSSGSGDGPDCAIGGVSPAYPSAATEPAPSASRHFPPTDLLHRTDRDPDGKRPPRAGALASSSPARHYPERREGRNAGGLGGSGGGGANFFYFREEAEVSAALGYSPVRMPDQKQNEKQNKTKKNNCRQSVPGQALHRRM